MSYRVPISTESERFDEHLKQEGNKRLLFSAPFGAGKSFFLKELFKEHGEYLTVTLQPTDYSVSSNTDVFELIKHDILTQIFERFSDFLDLNEADFNDLLLAQSFVLNKLDFYNLAKSALKAFIPNAESLDSVKEGISKLIEDYKNNSKDLTSTEEDAVVKYLVDIRMQKGSPRELDFFTAKIKEYVNQIRESSKKEIVLIIDDLDRLDAEHIFRIFNIFTAHNDSRFETNKFTFDKVILICDINTVEHLFHHKYGEKAEFHGYIDKFYSQSIFFFNNKKFLIESIKKLVSGKECLSKYYPKESNLLGCSSIYGIERTDFYNVFESIISSLISREHVRIRNFIRFREYSLPNINIHHQASPVPGDRYPLIVLIHLLGQFFARPVDLEAALKTLAEEFESDYSTGKPKYYDNSGIEKLIIQYSLPFLYEFDFLGDIHIQRQFQFQNEIGNAITIIYAYNSGLLNGGIKYINSVGGHSTTLNQDGTLTGESINRPNAYWMLYKAVLNCRKSKLELRLFNL